MLTIQNVAEMFGVCPTSLHSWERKGILHPDWVSPGDKIQRRYFYSEEKVKTLFESCFQCEDHNFTMNPGEADKKFLMPCSEVADKFEVKSSTIKRWEKKGVLSAVWVSPTGRRYYSKEQVDALYNQGYHTGYTGGEG